MSTRIFSQTANNPSMSTPRISSLFVVLIAFQCSIGFREASGQNAAPSRPGYFTDPQTGIVYRQVSKTIERPVVETKIEKKEQTLFRPQVITETKPETQTVYTPVVEYKWEPRLHGRWNPFQQPTVAYHHVPTTRWEARNQVVQRSTSRTQWVAEKRSVEVPQQVVRMERHHKVEFEAVGTIAQPESPTETRGINNAVAARLRPLPNQARVEPLGSTTNRFVASSMATRGRLQPAPRIAASTVGRMTSDPPRRNRGQSGLRATELTPSRGQIRGRALPPSTGGAGVANLSSLPFMR